LVRKCVIISAHTLLCARCVPNSLRVKALHQHILIYPLLWHTICNY
jgi:hypothetical protein